MNATTQKLRPIEKLTRPLISFLHIESASGIVLLAATAVALAIANTSGYTFYNDFWNLKFTIGVGEWALSYPLWYWVNDGLMAIFFFLVGLEIKREIVCGELREVRRVVAPAVAAFGGAIVPALIFIYILGDNAGSEGWAIPMATDIAFVVGTIALLGKRVPHGLKVFLLTLAIIDDIIAVLVIALFYSSKLSFAWLAAAAGGIIVVVIMNRFGVRTVMGYLLVGAGVWLCTLKSGIHPTIAGVVLGLLTPAMPLFSKSEVRKGLGEARQAIDAASDMNVKKKDVLREAEFISREGLSPLERFESDVHPWAAFIIMPIFALANAGVPFHVEALASPMALAVAFGLFLGKPIGIVLSLLLVVKTRLGVMPGGTTWGAMIGAGSLAGIGFTMSLFVASLSLEGGLLNEAKTGILTASAVNGIVGYLLLLFFLRKSGEAHS
ncbi:MAG: Na+/H+ antiporter NhaA [Candidatus Zixiibacteriota bacterium]